MPESLGARLRHRREQRGVALRTIADQTKIKASLLEALERDDVSHWPPGIFRRAYFRAYADAIGLDVDTGLREFLTAHPDPHDAVETAATADAVAGDSRSGSAPPTRIRMMLTSAIGAMSRLRRGRASDDLEPAAAPLVPSPAASDPADAVNAAITDCIPVNEGTSSEPDFLAVARLCTEFGRVGADDVQPLLREAAGVLDASGLIVYFLYARAVFAI